MDSSKKPKIRWSELYGCYVCIYLNHETGKWTIEKCDSKEEANQFVTSLNEQLSLPWYMNN